MNRIHVLDKTIAELIAAGEVVERPASIVKELLENAIDAGATKITVEIKGGGIGYLRISDNGTGIHQEDIPYAFLRHATSKVATAADLDAIDTLGFRGEALSSIAAVSKVELTTKTAESLDGWFYEIHEGVALEIPKPIGAPDGTTLVIRDLFSKIPARMKFLRRDIAEGNAVAAVVDKCALSNPEIAFLFIRDTKTRLQTSGNGDLKAVIAAVYGRDMADGLLEVDYNYENRIRVTGYVGSPASAKPSRTYQTFFVNGRYVRTRTCGVALEEAFRGKLMTGKSQYPVAVLSVTLEPSQVDANVHPAKIEVRFSEERAIYNAVYFGVKGALSKTEIPLTAQFPKKAMDSVTPFSVDISVTPPPQERLVATETIPIYQEDPAFSGRLELSSPRVEQTGQIPQKDLESFQKFISDTMPTGEPKEEEQATVAASENKNERNELKYLGELFGTYLLLESEAGELVLVDKHAAHERIKYEEILNNTLAGNRQLLLASVPVTLSREEYGAVLENLSTLETLGFLVEDFGTGTLLVRESPVVLDGKDITFLLSEIAAKLLESSRDLTPDALSSLYYSIACKSAVRGGDRNSKEELLEIIQKLEENPQITHCPHGRPVTARLSRYEIEKLFGRQG